MHTIYSGIRKKQTKKIFLYFVLAVCTVFTKYVDYTNDTNTQC